MYAIALSGRGRVCWKLPLSAPAEGMHTSAEPLASDGRAFFSSDGEVRAVSVTKGRREWTWSSGSAARARVRAISAADGTVIATKGGSLVGLGERTGAERWERAEPQAGATPVPTGDGGVLYTLNSGEVAQVVDNDDGDVRWQGPQAPPFPGSGAVPVAAVVWGPAIVGDAVVSTLTDGGAAAVSLRSGSELWRSAGPVLRATPAGQVVVLTPPPGPAGAYEVRATAVDPATGRHLWQTDPFDPGGVNFSDAGGALVYQDFARNPTLARLDPATGQDLWRVTTRPWRTVASGDRLVGVESVDYMTGPTTVVGRDLATGEVRWQTPAPFTAQNTNFQLLPVRGPAGDGIVLVRGNDLTAYDAVTGAVAWSFSLPTSALLDGVGVIGGGGLVVQASGCKFRVVSRGSGPCPGTN